MATATITASALSYMNAQWEDLADTPLVFKGSPTTAQQLHQSLYQCTGQQRDALWAAAITAAQDGHKLIERILLQTVIPQVLRYTRATRRLGAYTSRGDWDEAFSIGLTAFLEAIKAFPVETCHKSVMGTLYLNALHRITSCTPRQEPQVTVTDPHQGIEMSSDEVRDDALEAEEKVEQLLGWACETGTLTPQEAQLLLLYYRNPQQAATQCGISAAGMRKRAERLRQRIKESMIRIGGI
jgi:hypothetical protein